MKNLCLLLALMLVSCSCGERKTVENQDRKILEINNNVKSINQKVYRVVISDNASEKRTSDNGDGEMILSLGTGTIYGVHNLIENKIEREQLLKEGADFSPTMYPDFTKDCNFALNFNKGGDLTSYNIYNVGVLFRTECKYHSNNYIKEKYTYTIGGVYESFGEDGFLQLESKYNNKGQMIEEVYYGGVYNNNHQIESSYEYSKIAIAYDNNGRKVSSTEYSKGIISKTSTFKYDAERVVINHKSYDEYGNDISSYQEIHLIDENGEIIEEEMDEIMLLEYEVLEGENTMIEEAEVVEYKYSKLHKGFRTYYDANNRFISSEPAKHEMKETIKYDQQNNWIEKRIDYVYEDGSVEYGEFVCVRDIQYY